MEIKQQKISISFYAAPVRPLKPPCSVTGPAAGPMAHRFDRRAMLLAYAQQLRRTPGDQFGALPDWNKWKIAFAAHHGMRRRSRWGFKVVGGRPRRWRKMNYERLEAAAGNCSGGGGGGKEGRRWRTDRVCRQWRHVVRWISRKWRNGWRLMGSYFKSQKYHCL
ncbi:uncharacterized protein LOC110029012 [Phalaenopsis equestris]|uniref:uncharacterized protein LOC110029012 n=1 Tax=Phalaenopsis equestris TaxID=78828 RepID=UPI0009E28B6C|nr:uncharacterized protein LOC110029012 [Phalaenopsis equestris]